ncbi:MAG: class II aldolase/adducin family protein [Alphaproteobacteria bacterium]|nr:class II aldolase/adducin family protein [Alphaproteobacteria bacterium]
MDVKQAAALAVANRILYNEGVVDGFGHVSVRDARHADRFLLARSMAPGLVTPKDIMQFDLAGMAIEPRGRAVYLERFIHGSIYKARPDVMAVVHSHSPSIIPFGITPQKLRPVYHMSGFLGDDVPIFDIHEVAGDTDLLVSSVALGDALARALGGNIVALMRGHGSVAAGQTLQHAVYRAVYAEINARLQSEALKLGPVKYLTPGEARATKATLDKALSRAYELWARRVGTKG